MAPSILAASPLPAAEQYRIDRVCAAFEQAWQAGQPGPLQGYLEDLEPPLRPHAAAELIRLELEWRCRRGEAVPLHEYSRRFPEHAATLTGWLAEAQAAVRQIAEARPQEPAAAPAAAAAAPLPDSGQVTPPSRPDATPEPALAALPAGVPRTLGGYDLLEPLGAGGMGEVYKARHRRLGKLVAVKLLPADRRGVRESLERFAREIRAVGELDHPHLIEAHDAGEQDGIVYLVLKLIDGTDLHHLVKEHGPLPVAEACEVVRQAALALQHLHERGLVHRDIKPGNLMRTPAGQVRLLDLGLARWQTPARPPSELTETGRALGTPDYMAPEQADDAAAVDIRADLYSLGATLFYLLTGATPFGHLTSRSKKLRAHVEQPPPDVRKLRADVPDGVCAVVAKLLAKRPAERYATPQDLADDLAHLLAGLAPTAARVPPPRRSRRWLAAAGLLALAGGAAALALSIFPPSFANREPNPPPAGLVEIRKLEVRHLAQVDERDQPRGAMGVHQFSSFSTRLGDGVIIRGELSAPAYCYLIAYRPDGTPQLCFPEDERTPPPLTAQPGYGSLERESYGLSEGEGLMAFALVVSRWPLPAYEAWRAQRGHSPWRKTAAPADLMWRYERGELFEVTPDAPGGLRGKGRKLRGVEPLVELIDWLKETPDLDDLTIVAFPVLPALK